MNFKITDTYRFWWPVTVRMPDQKNAGKIIEQKFEAYFEALSDERAKALDKAFNNLKTDEERQAHEHDVLREVLKDWKGVVGEDDQKQPFTAELREVCINNTWFRAGVYEAYRQAMRAEAAGDGPTTKN